MSNASDDSSIRKPRGRNHLNGERRIRLQFRSAFVIEVDEDATRQWRVPDRLDDLLPAIVRQSDEPMIGIRGQHCGFVVGLVGAHEPIDIPLSPDPVCHEVDRAELGEHRGDWGRLQDSLAAQWDLLDLTVDFPVLQSLQVLPGL